MNCACMLCSQNTEVVIRSIAPSGFCVLKDRTEEDFLSVWIPWGKSEGAGSFSDEKRKGKKTIRSAWGILSSVAEGEKDS